MTAMRELRLQAAKQTVFGTGVTPTVLLRGVEDAKFTAAREMEVREDLAIALAGGDTAMLYALSAAGSVSGWASYEHICYWLDNLLGEATPGAGPGYARAYAAPIATAPTRRILSLVYGDGSVGAYQMIGALCNAMTLRFEAKKALEFNADLVGVGLAADTLEALAIPTVNPIMATHLDAIKMDSWAGTMGTTTLAACTLRSAELSIDAPASLRHCFGSLSPSTYVEMPYDGSLKLVLEWNATSKAVVDELIAGTSQRQVQLTATSSSKIFQVQFAGSIEDDVDIFDDDDGVVTASLTLKRTYHSTFANWLKINVTNGVSALT